MSEAFDNGLVEMVVETGGALNPHGGRATTVF